MKKIRVAYQRCARAIFAMRAIIIIFIHFCHYGAAMSAVVADYGYIIECARVMVKMSAMAAADTPLTASPAFRHIFFMNMADISDEPCIWR